MRRSPQILAARRSHDRFVLPGGKTRVVVVADTHSQPHPAMAERLREQAPALILHGGDIGELTVLDGLAEHAPVLAVRGNIDGHGPSIPDLRIIDLEAGDFSLRLLLTHIALSGPRLRSEVRRAAEEARAPLVVCGHSHVPFIGVDHGITVFNPGSAGPRRFALPILFGALDFAGGRVRLQHLECASGARWEPPG